VRRTWIICGLIVVAIVIVAAMIANPIGRGVLLGFLGAPTPAEMYPPAPPMPPVVATRTEDLLAQYENFLREKVPAAFSVLQPGLTDVEIDKLEQQYQVTLPSDLRALYRWQNGTRTGADVDVFPGVRFEPLDVAFGNRDKLRKEVEGISPVQRLAYDTFAGHTDPWLCLFADGFGDGYFFDPTRTEAQGSFFYSFKEDGDYTFFPAFRNYLAAVNDGQRAGVFRQGQRGVETVEFEKAQELWEKYGASPSR
jgi:cell wall assembly regulator SMI1